MRVRLTTWWPELPTADVQPFQRVRRVCIALWREVDAGHWVIQTLHFEGKFPLDLVAICLTALSFAGPIESMSDDQRMLYGMLTRALP